MPSNHQNEADNRSSDKVSLDCVALMEIAGRELYQHNAFRVTGLATDASAREIAKHGDHLKMQEELGHVTTPVGGPFDRKSPPTLDEIRQSLQRLRNPEKRIVDEFFWVWPEEFGNSHGDAALRALLAGDDQMAISAWRTQESADAANFTATHNLAIAHSMAALDYENESIGRGMDEEARAYVAAHWKSAMKRWLRLVDNDRMWETVTARIRQLNEPNLPTGFSRQMRHGLRAALAKVHAELALAYGAGGQAAYARRQVDLMKQIGGATPAAELVVDQGLSPARNLLRQQISRALQRSAETATEGLASTRELLGHARKAFSGFDLLQSSEVHSRCELSDELADACMKMLFAHHHAKTDDQATLELLELVQPHAQSAEIKKRIRDNLSVLKGNITFAKLTPLLTLMKQISESVDRPPIRFALFSSKVMPMLTLAGTEYAADEPALVRVFEEGAMVLRGISLDAWNKHKDISTAQATNAFAITLAREPDTRKQLLADKAHLELEANRLAAAARSQRNTWIGWGVGIGVFVLVSMCNSNSSSSKPTTSHSYSPRSSDEAETYRVPNRVKNELDEEARAIEVLRAEVLSAKIRLDTLSQTLERENTTLDHTSDYAVDADRKR